MSAGIRYRLAILLAVVLGSHALQVGAADRTSTAPAAPSSLKTERGKPESISFDFGDFRASLTPKGLIGAQGTVRHRGLACATYSVEIRFGAGKPDCTSPEWISRKFLVSERAQCNDAAIEHRGGDTDPGLERIYDRITCAELVVRCRGNCK